MDRPLIRKAITIRFHSSSSAQLLSWDTRQACRWKTSFGMDCTKLQRAKVLRHLHSSSGSTPSALFTIFHRPSGFSYWIISELALIRPRKLPPKPANVWWSCLTRNVSKCCGPDNRSSRRVPLSVALARCLLLYSLNPFHVILGQIIEAVAVRFRAMPQSRHCLRRLP